MTYDNDIALIRLKNPKCGQKSIAYVKDEKEEQKLLNPVNTKWLYVSGWGNDKINGYEYPKKINIINVMVVARDICTTLYNRSSGESYFTENMLCAGYNEHNFCDGDSGGPLFINNGDVSVQIGIVSSFRNISDHPCGAMQNYGKYTRLYKYQQWIKNNSVKPYTCETQSTDSTKPIYHDR